MRTRCQPSSMRRAGPEIAPLKRKLCGPFGVSKKRSSELGASRLIMDSKPIASGFWGGALNANRTSQATSQPLGAGPNEKFLFTASLASDWVSPSPATPNVTSQVSSAPDAEEYAT